MEIRIFDKNNKITYDQIISAIFVLSMIFGVLLMALAGPGVYFASELKKYVSLAIVFFVMIIFSFKKGFYKSYVFFSCLVFCVDFAIVYMFYPQDSLVIGDAHKLMIPDLFMLLGALCFIALPHRHASPHPKSPFSTILYFVAFLWFLFALCLASSHDVYALAEALNYGRMLVVYLIFSFAFKADSEAHKYFLYGLALLVIIQGAVGFLQQLGVNIFLRFTDASFTFQAGSLNRVSGTIGRVRLHSLLSLALPFLLAQVLWISGGVRRFLMITAMILGVIGLALTRNRGPLMATIVGCMYVCYSLKRLRVIKFNARFLLYGSVILIMTGYFFFMGAASFQQVIKRPTYLGRIYQDKSVIESIYNGGPIRFFFGFGPHQYIFHSYGLKKPFKSPRKFKNIYNIHNQYLLLLYESGVIGLLLYLVWFCSFFIKTTIQKRSEGSIINYARIYKTGIGGALLSLALVSFTRPVYDDVSITILGVYMALLASLQSSSQINNR